MPFFEKFEIKLNINQIIFELYLIQLLNVFFIDFNFSINIMFYSL